MRCLRRNRLGCRHGPTILSATNWPPDVNAQDHSQRDYFYLRTPAVPEVHVLVSSLGASAFPSLGQGRHSTRLCTATSVQALISGLQSFADVQASDLARPPGRSHRGAPECIRAARALTFEPDTGRYLPVHRTC